MNAEIKERKIRQLNKKKPALKTLNRDTMRMELCDMQEACDQVAYYTAEGDETLLSALLGNDEIDAEELRTSCIMLSGEIDQMLSDMNDPEVFPPRFDKIMTFTAHNADDDVLCYDSVEGDYYGCYWSMWDQDDLKKSLMNLSKEQIIMEFRQSLQVALSFLALKARYDNLDCAADILKGESAERCKTAIRINEIYEERNGKAFYEFERLVNSLPPEEWVK